MTSQEVARRSGIAPGSYSCLENGWYKINLDNLFRILQVLKADVIEVWPSADADQSNVIDDSYLQDVVRDAMASQPREITLDDVYEAVCHFRARARKGTHSTKNRADVAGGGRKPWKQKKTGRSRHGSSRCRRGFPRTSCRRLVLAS